MSRSDRVIRTVGDKRRFVVLLLVVIISFGWANAPLPAQQTEEKPDELADLTLEELMKLDILPINVLGTHTHLAGEWMIGYKFMFMRMDGNRDGTDRKTVSDVLQDFPVAPTEMTMAMHMVEVHCCPVKSRIESIGWGHRGIRLGSRMAGVPVKGAFFRIA